MKLVDLTRTLDPRDIELMPQGARAFALNLAPPIEYISHSDSVADMCAEYACRPDDLPGQEGMAREELRLSTHSGTHVDAPWHYGSMCEELPSRTITDIDVNELFCEGMVLDLRGRCAPGEGIGIEALEAAQEANGRDVQKGDAILLRTGQESFGFGDREMFNHPGMTREGTMYLAGLGAKVLGIDALGWDRPVHVMRRAFRETGDPGQIWDGHFAGREREVFIVQQLANLAALPPNGFKVGFFPLKLARCSGAPARVVAFLPE